MLWPWLLTAVRMERMRVMSSAISARCGRSSLSSIPDWPRGANCHGDPKTLLLASAALSYWMSPGNFWPWYLVSWGFGSKRSIWLGPPIMKREIMALALPKEGGGFGERSKRSPSVKGLVGAAEAASRWRSHGRARAPRLKPWERRNCRREMGDAMW